jgi:hypothetical protein
MEKEILYGQDKPDSPLSKGLNWPVVILIMLSNWTLSVN